MSLILPQNLMLTEVFSDPKYFIRTNVIGTNVLLESAKRFGVEKFLQVSTDEVYGSLR